MDREKVLKAKTGIDRILDRYEMRDCTDFICTQGGDSITYRVYDNGEIVIK